ncbi:type II toxin-antitoxin system VapC family toxin [Microvirga rosea]|uniref:type II toxin-antitoxin system VapC family toxin n=1 Tax=Microvirga rosea TaxID=2715425 RepID=UPI001D0A0413|nr:type II toxin-antitoxin system VapC family toxin [Microvirga rosea]MCB8822885.1 type II toxin-antitoxin system VapC family toxin [Microvirga rosea]
MMYLETSAIIALLAGEPEATDLARRIDEAKTNLITSPVSVTEAVVRFATIKGVTIPASQEIVSELLAVLKAQTISITPEIGNKATRAYAQYGKGTGHGAKLNLADVFSYACAKAYRVPLLYKGNDFAKTDLA